MRPMCRLAVRTVESCVETERGFGTQSSQGGLLRSVTDVPKY